MSDKVVTLYWRPGCGFCSALERQLAKQEIVYERRNIWDDPEAAAFVRSIARGNETVPTVTVGETSMVNPGIYEVVEAIATTSSSPGGGMNDPSAARVYATVEPSG